MPDPYQLTDEARVQVDAARAIANDVALPAAAEVDAEARFPRETIDALAAGGFFGLCLPPEVNGAGHPPRVFAAVVEELAQACPSSAMIYVMHVSATAAIATSETLADRVDLLEAIAAGKQLATLAISEKGSRSQFWAAVSKLERDGDGFVTHAAKSWVTSASHADLFIASGQQPGAASPMESTLYLIRKEAEGLKVAGRFDGLGLRGNDSAPMAFENLKIAADDLITAQGSGVAMMLEVILPWFVVGTSAMANGICRAAVNATARHLSATGFEHDATQLRDLPNLRARIAEMSSRTEQSTALLASTTRMMEAPDETTPLFVLQSRLTALQAAADVTDLAMKTCGGAAFSKHLALERYFRDARAGWVMAPTVDHLRDFIGKALTGLPLF